MAAVRVPGEFAGGAGGGDHLGVRHPAVDRDLLPGDAAGVQALQGVQHDDERHEDRRGRSARHHGSVLPYRDYLYHLVHVRIISALPRVSQQNELLSRRHEHHRHHRDHSVLHHPGHRGGRGGRHHQRAARARLPAGQEHEPSHVVSHTQSD